MDTFTELRQLADDLTELGDTATAAFVRAIDLFSARRFDAGEELIEGALAERVSDFAPRATKSHWKRR
jgi:hypothetical protein